jgi:hypothetical protein
MERESIANQLRIEQELIGHIETNLRQALDWKTGEEGASRKLSTMRFIAEAFHRHLGRLMAIHEYDGYMSYIAQSNVQLIPAVDRIKEEHNQLRGRLHRLVSQLERLSPHDLVALEDACDSVRALLAEYDRHRQKEMHLIQEAFLRDFGGLE